MENNGRTLIILLVVALLVAAGAYLFYDMNRDDIIIEPDEAAMDRDEEPETETTWRFATTTEYSFQYPADLNLEYVEMTDWPPVVEVTDDVFTCEEAGAETDRAGRTEAVTVGTREYCRTTVMEGAAGSVYTQYAYAFPHNEGTAIMTFSTRAPVCANYDSAEMSACENELEGFDTDELADRMARTFNLVGEDEE